MRKLGNYKGFPCYVTTLTEYELHHEDSVVYVICNPDEGFDVNKPRDYAMVLNGMKIAVWDGKAVRECAVSGSPIKMAGVDAARGHENGSFSEYSVVVDKFFEELEK